MLKALGTLAERRAGWVVAVWALAGVVLATMAPSLSKVGIQDETALLPAAAPSQRAQAVLRQQYPNDPTLDSAIVVFSRRGRLGAVDHSYMKTVSFALADQVHQVKTVQSPEIDPTLTPLLNSSDGKAELLVVGFRNAPFADSTKAAVAHIRAIADGPRPPGLVDHVTGVSAIGADEAAGIVSSFARTALISAVLVIIALLLVYRSVVAALVPLVTIGVAYAVAEGVVGLMAAHGFKVASLAQTFMVVMVFGAGTDYCLFIVSRYRRELATGGSVPSTVARATTMMGAVLTASAATLVLGFSSQLVARFGMYRAMGPAVAVAIAITLIASLTLTPALLRLLGRRAFWPTSIDAVRADQRHAGLWASVATRVAAHPAEVTLGAISLLLLSAGGIGWLHQSFNLLDDLPQTADARTGFAVLSRHYPPGQLAPASVVVNVRGPIVTDTRLSAIDHLTDRLRSNSEFAEVRSVTQPAGAPLTSANFAALTGGSTRAAPLGLNPPRTPSGPLTAALRSPAGLRLTGPVLRSYPQLRPLLDPFLGVGTSSTRVIVTMRDNPYSPAGLDAIRRLGPEVNAAVARTPLAGASVSIGGPASFFADMQTLSNADFRLIVVVLMAAILLVLGLLLRSVVAPLYLLATVVLSYVSTLGLLVIVSRELLGYEALSFWVPPFLFAILVALGADYNIFIMSRIAEERSAGWETREAAVRGLMLTGPVISSAGLILAGTFAALMAAPLPALREIGFGVTLGVLIDTFVVRSTVVPAVTLLLGRCAFWPTGRIHKGEERAERDPVGWTAGHRLAATGPHERAR